MACYWAGVAVNPINIRWSANEIAYSLDDCDTRILLVDDNFAPLMPEILKLSRSLQTLIHLGDGPAPQNMLSYEALVADSSPVEDAMRSGDDLAGVFYTGGTTGSPKGSCSAIAISIPMPSRACRHRSCAQAASACTQLPCSIWLTARS